MLKKFFVPHLEKFLSRFEVLADPLFRNVKITFGYPPPKNPQFSTVELELLTPCRGITNAGKGLPDF